MVWYSHLLKNFPQFLVIHTVKGFGIVNKTEVDVFLQLLLFRWSNGIIFLIKKLFYSRINNTRNYLLLLIKTETPTFPTAGAGTERVDTLNTSEFGQVSKNRDAGHNLTIMGLFPLQEGDEFSLTHDGDLPRAYSGSFETWEPWPNTGHSKSQLQTEEAHISLFCLGELPHRKSSGRYFQGAHSVYSTTA